MSNNNSYISNYNKQNTYLFTLRLNKVYDSDIIEFFSKIQSDGVRVSTYLKVLIRLLINGHLSLDQKSNVIDITKDVLSDITSG